MRWWAWTLIGIVVFAVIVRVVADPLATHITRRGLQSIEGYTGEVSDVHVGLLDLSFTVTDLKLTESGPGSAGDPQQEPLFYAKRSINKVLWKDLLRLDFTGTTRVESAKATLQADSKTSEKAQQKSGGGSQKAVHGPAGLGTIDQTLKKIMPARAARMEVMDTELVYVDRKVKPAARLYVSGLEVTVENIATRERLTGGRATTIAAHATVQKSGELTMFVSADPLAEKLNFAGRMELRHLRLADMHGFVAGYSGLSIPRGTFDLFAEFTVKDDYLRGGIKPVLHDVDIQSTDANVGNLIKEKLASAAYSLLSRDEKEQGRDDTKLATVVPITGNLAAPEVDVYAALLGVMRNAFVTGLSEGFSRLPPPLANKSDGPLDRASDALSRDGRVTTKEDGK